jgi:hypothetical protein
MTSVTMVLNVDSYTYLLQEITDDANIDKHIVIDNTPIPIGGASAASDVTFMLQIITDFNMPYNIKTLTMYAGLLCLSLVLMIIATMYVCCKTRNDVIAKKTKLEAESDGRMDQSLIKEEDRDLATPKSTFKVSTIGDE